MPPLTKKDLKEALKPLATKDDLKELATKKDLELVRKDIKLVHEDLIKHDKRANEMIEILRNVPTRDDFPQLLEKTFEFATLKAEHERIKQIIHEKLHVEV